MPTCPSLAAASALASVSPALPSEMANSQGPIVVTIHTHTTRFRAQLKGLTEGNTCHSLVVKR